MKKNLKKNLIHQRICPKKIIYYRNLALNYGSKYELVDTFQKLKKKKNINIKDIENNLYTARIPDPDILIRTANLKRLNNFWLWQLAY